jgi:methionyl aminopeptidase
MIGKGVYPSPLGYCGFPKSICTSVNNVGTAFLLDCSLRSFNLMLLHQVICHGIPDDRILLDGDVVKIDVSVYAPLHMALHNALVF